MGSYLRVIVLFALLIQMSDLSKFGEVVDLTQEDEEVIDVTQLYSTSTLPPVLPPSQVPPAPFSQNAAASHILQRESLRKQRLAGPGSLLREVAQPSTAVGAVASIASLPRRKSIKDVTRMSAAAQSLTPAAAGLTQKSIADITVVATAFPCSSAAYSAPADSKSDTSQANMAKSVQAAASQSRILLAAAKVRVFKHPYPSAASTEVSLHLRRIAKERAKANAEASVKEMAERDVVKARALRMQNMDKATVAAEAQAAATQARAAAEAAADAKMVDPAEVDDSSIAAAGYERMFCGFLGRGADQLAHGSHEAGSRCDSCGSRPGPPTLLTIAPISLHQCFRCTLYFCLQLSVAVRGESPNDIGCFYGGGRHQCVAADGRPGMIFLLCGRCRWGPQRHKCGDPAALALEQRASNAETRNAFRFLQCAGGKQNGDCDLK